MKMNKFVVVLGISFLFLLNNVAFAQNCSVNIDWQSLNLTPKQVREIYRLENEWKMTKASIMPKLISDQEALKLYISNPETQDEQLREVHAKISLKQHQLQQLALENF
ncbi:MAG: hypothetical protein M0C28_39760 [Candidatus Moduliflexus flocculans]|nr:hypothetical protein [Candidatus Moduliflexus flocculans]